MGQVAPHRNQLCLGHGVDVDAEVADGDPLFVRDVQLDVAETFLILLEDYRVWQFLYKFRRWLHDRRRLSLAPPLYRLFLRHDRDVRRDFLLRFPLSANHLVQFG